MNPTKFLIDWAGCSIGQMCGMRSCFTRLDVGVLTSFRVVLL